MKIILLGSKSKVTKYKDVAMFLYGLESKDVKIYSSESSVSSKEDAVVFKPSSYKSFEANVRDLVEACGISPADHKIIKAVSIYS